jgi:hypothetical protein
LKLEHGVGATSRFHPTPDACAHVSELSDAGVGVDLAEPGCGFAQGDQRLTKCAASIRCGGRRFDAATAQQQQKQEDESKPCSSGLFHVVSFQVDACSQVY